GKRLKRLASDPVTTPVVQRIFHEYVMGIGIYALAQRLTSDGIPSPSAYDPDRNTHRCGLAWSKSAVRCPSATSSTSMSDSCFRCLFHTW
ncbi:MAG TPA: recombinase family protein, partial [Pseudonocardiaceae bacterium]